VAEGHPAVHAASPLLAQLSHGPREQELAVVVRSLQRVTLRDAVTLDLNEAPELAHQQRLSPAAQAPLSPTASSRAPVATAPFSAAVSASASRSASSRSTRL